MNSKDVMLILRDNNKIARHRHNREIEYYEFLHVMVRGETRTSIKKGDVTYNPSVNIYFMLHIHEGGDIGPFRA